MNTAESSDSKSPFKDLDKAFKSLKKLRLKQQEEISSSSSVALDPPNHGDTCRGLVLDAIDEVLAQMDPLLTRLNELYDALEQCPEV